MDPEQIAQALYPMYSMDAVHEAIAALLALPKPPQNPMGWCRRVAQRIEINEYRHHSTREGHPRLLHITGIGVNPPTGGDGESLDLGTQESRLFGTLDPPQLRRLEAREILEGLDSVDVARGLGYFDPPPTVPVYPGGRSENDHKRHQYEEWRKRRRRRVSSE